MKKLHTIFLKTKQIISRLLKFPEFISIKKNGVFIPAEAWLLILSVSWDTMATNLLDAMVWKDSIMACFPRTKIALM